MPAPTSRWPDGDSRRFEVGSRRLPANTRFLLDAPQRPSQPSQRDDLLPFFFAQDIAHSMEGMPPSISMSCPLSIGRFSSVPHWPVLGVPRSHWDWISPYRCNAPASCASDIHHRTKVSRRSDRGPWSASNKAKPTARKFVDKVIHTMIRFCRHFVEKARGDST